MEDTYVSGLANEKYEKTNEHLNIEQLFEYHTKTNQTHDTLRNVARTLTSIFSWTC